MRKFGFIILALTVMALGVVVCGKKQKSLEEMQEPMSMESLSTLKSEGTQQAQGEAPAATTSTAAVSKTAPEPLPPSGPFKPTATEIQTALQAAGYYSGTIDGKIGPKTKKAIEEFQKANGLTADGKVGSRTWALLSKHLSAVPAGKPGD